MRTISMLVLSLSLSACQQAFPVNPNAVPVHALLETAPVADGDDAADDPAIWVNPQDPARSLVLGTDKKQGLAVYDLQGNQVQFLKRGRLNNVDLRSGVQLGGETATLAIATNRTEKTLDVFRISDNGQVDFVLAQASRLADPYGTCMQLDSKGQAFVFANSTDGSFEQWLLNPDGSLAPTLRGTFKFASQTEGCAVDDQTGTLYVGEEDVGVWAMPASAERFGERRLLDRVGEGHMVADVEGMDVYRRGNELYLIVSSQGDHSYAVYDLHNHDAFLGSFRVTDNPANNVDGTEETDGLAITPVALDARFPDGLLVLQDGYNLKPAENQNFKLLSWRDVLQALSTPTQ